MSTTNTGSSSHRSPASGSFPGVPSRPADVARILDAIGVVPSRRWGQSFLVDPFVADAEAALVAVPPGTPVLEIGGGLGLLTAALLRRGIGPLTVVERDRRLAQFLRTTFGDRITVLEADALAIDLPPAGCVVGNLPFWHSTSILLRLFEARAPYVVAMVQQEVAERVGATSGSRAYGRLSIIARLYGTPELFLRVPSESFYPVPEVSAQVLVHSARKGPLPVPSVERLEHVVRMLFSSRRKQLGNLLSRVATVPGEVDIVVRDARWPDNWSSLRPEDLDPEAYFRLATVLENRAK